LSGNFGLTDQERLAVLQGQKNIALAFRILEYVATCKEGTTCHECAVGVPFPYQAGSVRYHELVKVGCLVATGKRRKTSGGGTAAVHRVAWDANFKRYLRHVLSAGYRKKRVVPGLGEKEQQVLAAGLDFLREWKRSKSRKGRENAAVLLVNRLASL